MEERLRDRKYGVRKLNTYCWWNKIKNKSPAKPETSPQKKRKNTILYWISIKQKYDVNNRQLARDCKDRRNLILLYSKAGVALLTHALKINNG